MCILENYLRYSSQFEEVPQKLDTSYMDDSDASDSETDSDDETEKFSRPSRVSSSSEESYEIEYSSESDEGSSFGSEVETDFTDEEGEENKRDGNGEEKSLAEGEPKNVDGENLVIPDNAPRTSKPSSDNINVTNDEANEDSLPPPRKSARLI